VGRVPGKIKMDPFHHGIDSDEKKVGAGLTKDRAIIADPFDQSSAFLGLILGLNSDYDVPL